MKTLLPVFLTAALMVAACRSKTGTKEITAAEDSVREQPARIYTEPQTATSSADEDPGGKVYNEYCLSCHQTGGTGAPGMFPPLNKNEFTSDKTKLISTVLHGLEGAVTVNGQEFSNIMPAQDYLTDYQIAAVLTYILRTFVKSDETVSAEEVASLR